MKPRTSDSRLRESSDLATASAPYPQSCWHTKSARIGPRGRSVQMRGFVRPGRSGLDFVADFTIHNGHDDPSMMDFVRLNLEEVLFHDDHIREFAGLDRADFVILGF